MQKEELVKELFSKFTTGDSGCDVHFDDLADWVLTDRKRIVEPLIKYKNEYYIGRDFIGRGMSIHPAEEALISTLKNAGVEESKCI